MLQSFDNTSLDVMFGNLPLIHIARPRLFLANVGGIIALFLGCSFISICEIVYFLSIRLFINYRRLCIQNGLVKVPMYLE